jgi:hypothetical protein
VALFATPGVPGVHPIEQYPAAAMPPSAMPRPVIPQGAVVDPALQQTSAFQRRAPYAPERPDPAHAHTHA